MGLYYRQSEMARNLLEKGGTKFHIGCSYLYVAQAALKDVNYGQFKQWGD
jgi:hypothetical protein